nr:hypothetical protein [uncultured Acetatifactor sp.]
MEIYLAKLFGISLALTIVVELPVAFILRLGVKRLGKRSLGKKKKAISTSNEGRQGRGTGGIAAGTDGQIRSALPVSAGGEIWPVLGSRRHLALLVVLVNLLTNPPAVLLCWLGRMYLPLFLTIPVQMLVELAVVAVEAWIYCSFMEKPGWQTGRPVLLSVTANLCSWTIGIVCGGWIDLAVTIALRLSRAW